VTARHGQFRAGTEVRLDESMLEDFKKQIMIAQVQNPV